MNSKERKEFYCPHCGTLIAVANTGVHNFFVNVGILLLLIAAAAVIAKIAFLGASYGV